MPEQTTRESFIVRVYRYDPENSGNITGMIEAIDGSGSSTPFRGIAELGAILSQMVNRRRSAAGNEKGSRRGSQDDAGE